MNYKKTIRILDPFYGWGMHADYYRELKEDSSTKHDTGLCNRLFHWELFYELCEKSKDDILTLIVQNMIWPELSILDMPNTVGIDYSLENSHWYGTFEDSELYFKTIFDIENGNVYLSEKLDFSKIVSMYKDNKFDFISKDHWYTEQGYHTLESIYFELYDTEWEKYIREDRPLTKITLRDKKLHRKLELRFANMIGIHIRRGNGVYITEEDINSFPTEYIEKFREYKKDYIKVVSDIYPFQQDYHYFEFIDFVLKLNPNQKFYISHDLPDEFMDYYYEKYGDSIVTKKDYRDEYIKHYSNKIKNLDHLIKYGNIIDNVMDLFSLANCKYLVESPGSSWSYFAKSYRKPPSIRAYEVPNMIENHSEKFTETIKQVIEEIPLNMI
jgi:hypothetical protein